MIIIVVARLKNDDIGEITTMKIVFLSNFFNHHQKPLSDQFYEKTNHQYYFVETLKMDEERIKLGWGGISKPEYVLYYYQDEETKLKCEKEIMEADAVITGSAPEFLVTKRLEAGKLVFRYSERPLKKGLELAKYPIRFIRWHRKNKKKYNVYMLCASAYTASDYAKFGLFKNKCFKWGYFTEVKQYENIETILDNKKKNSVLWCARFLTLKHPEIPVMLAKRLKEEGYDFTLKMIGVGEEKEKTEQLVQNLNLTDKIEFLGSMSPEEVRRHMEESEIFIFTSDRHEGWGAVLNESMNSGCAVVANREIGSAPYLIKDGENGFTYDGSLDDFYHKVKKYLDNPGLAKQSGLKAYETMTQMWNAKVAANRFLELLDAEKDKDLNLFDDGPCSPANIINDGWYKYE